MAYAHTLEGCGPADWEPLEKHLNEVSQRAGKFAEAFGAAAWGAALGTWHDLGKYSKAFQEYLLRTIDADAGEEGQVRGRVDHSTFGAQHAARKLSSSGERAAGQLLAFCIAGHHSGLTDATADNEGAATSSLKARLAAGPPRVPAVILPDAYAAATQPLRFPFKLHPTEIGFQVALFTRMLFSCLVDADRMATEAFTNPDRAIERNQPKPTIDDLSAVLDLFLDRIRTEAKPTPVNHIRAEVLADCIDAADLTPGFFSLDVPTGGGKTFSSLAFALQHAMRHDLRRVVVAIPFTSIIEQTAEVYRKALGEHAALGLIEHHSNIDLKRTRQNTMAVENWDAPLIVTTNVQLYESLFANATTPCRKLHRLAKSVIVLDEAQTIPIDLLTATLAALRRLVEDYGCTVVLCTATQPALKRNVEFKIGIDPEKVRDIIPRDRGLHAALKRVEVNRLGKVSDDELADRLAAERGVLCVVNTRPHASRLYDALIARIGKVGCYHLSTFMCAQHRRDKLAEIRQRLRDELPCRLISTQLIEAGVDVDFPCVYRAAAGFDSIAQAAGRCNREGLLEVGRVYVFETDQLPPAGLLRLAADAARELAGVHPDPLAPDAIEAYFRHVYWMQNHTWDKHEIMPCFGFDPRHEPLPLFKFRTAADKYQIIRDEQASVLVPYDKDARSLIARLNRGELDFNLLRTAQRYIVGVRGKPDEQGGVPAGSPLAKLIESHVVIGHESGLWLLGNEDAYSVEKGMSFEAVGLGPESLMV